MPYFIKQTHNSALYGIDLKGFDNLFFSDLDGDGKEDLLIGAESGEFKAYRNTDNGFSLVEVAELTDTNFNVNSSTTFVDIDGDGDGDVVTRLGNGEVKILRNNNGAFLALENLDSSSLLSNDPLRKFLQFNNFITSLNVAPGIELSKYAIDSNAGDIGQSGDSATASDASIGQTDTSLTHEQQTDSSQTAQNSILEDVIFVDFDRDGDEDKFVNRGDNTFDIYRNNNGNYFLDETSGIAQAPASYFVEQEQEQPEANDSTIEIATKHALPPTFVDLDGDGDLDAVVGYHNGDIEVYLNQDGKSILAATLENVGKDARPALGDVDSDGDLDILIGTRAGRLHYYQNQKDDGFVRQVGKKNPVQYVDVGYDAQPAFSDIDGDGDPDLVVSGWKLDSAGNREKELHHFDNFTPTPSLSNLTNISNNAFTIKNGGWTSQNQFPRHLADVNGDGRADIVAFGSTGVSVALGQTDGTFAKGLTAYRGYAARNGGWTSQDKFPRHLADVNGDGRADIIAFGSTGVSVALGQTDGTFAKGFRGYSGFTYRNGGWASQDKFPRYLGDVNGDGRADIVGFGTNQVVVALGQDDGTFAKASKAYSGFTYANGGWASQNKFPRHLADVNGDGRADIVGFGTTQVDVALGQDDGTFRKHTKLTHQFTHQGGIWLSQDKVPRLLADVTGDGLADVVGFGTSKIIVAQNNTVRPDPIADLFFESVFSSNDKSLWHDGDAFQYAWNFKEDIGFDGLKIPSIGNYSKSFGFARVNSGGIGGFLDFNTGVEIDSGTINTDLPLVTWFGLPNQTPRLGQNQTTTLKTGSFLAEDAVFETIFPYVSAFLEVDVEAKLQAPSVEFDVPLVSQDFELSPSGVAPNGIDVDKEVKVSFDTREGTSLEGIPSDEITLLMEVGEGENKQRTEAKKDKNKKGRFSLSDYLSFEMQSLDDMNLKSFREDDFTLIASNRQPFFQTRIDLDKILSDTTILPDLEYGESINYGIGSAFAEINLFDLDLVADFTLQQEIKLEVERIDGILTFEDQSTQKFVVGEDIDILLEANKVDKNGDGHVDVEVTVIPQVTLHNQTSMLYDLNVDFSALSGAAGFDVELDLGLLGSIGFHEATSFEPAWSGSMELQALVEQYYQHTLPGLIEEHAGLGIDLPTESITDLLGDGSINIYDNSFALGGFGSQSYEFTIPVLA